MCCCTFCILRIQKKDESTDEIMFLFLLPCFSLFSPVLTKNKTLQPGFVRGLTWGRSKASRDVRRPNGAVDDPLVTPECGQRPVESGVPLWVGNKNTWRSGERKRNWEETKIKKKKSTKTNRTHHFSGLIPRSRDDEVLSSGLTPVHRVHLQNTQSQYSIRVTTPTVVFFCERVACACFTSCVCSLATLSGASWLAVSHSCRLPSPAPVTMTCSLVSLQDMSKRPSLHSQLTHTQHLYHYIYSQTRRLHSQMYQGHERTKELKN